MSEQSEPELVIDTSNKKYRFFNDLERKLRGPSDDGSPLRDSGYTRRQDTVIVDFLVSKLTCRKSKSCLKYSWLFTTSHVVY